MKVRDIMITELLTRRIYANRRTEVQTPTTFKMDNHSQGNYDLAIHFMNKAIAGKKDCAPLYVNRGDAFLRLLDFPLALADYREALEIEPRDGGNVKSRLAFIYNQYGLALFQQVRVSECEGVIV